MSLRTKRETITFTKPFTLRGVDGLHKAGTYTVETDEAAIEGISFMAYRRVATMIFMPLHGAGPGSLQSVPVDPRDLAEALAGDVPQADYP